MVPEIPEVSAAFAVFREQGDNTRGSSERKSKETQETARGTVHRVGDGVQDPTSIERLDQAGQEVLERTRPTVAGAMKDEDGQRTRDQRSKDSQDESAEAPQLIETEPEGLRIERAESADVHQPYTPAYVVPEHPRTPETAPQTPQPNRSGEVARNPSHTRGGPPTLWNVPKTPSPAPDAVRAARGAVLPITPEATPDQLVKRQWPNFAAEEERAFRLEGDRCIKPEQEEGYVAVFEPQIEPRGLPQKSNTTPPPSQSSYPSAEVLSEDQTKQGNRFRMSKSDSGPANPGTVSDNLSADGDGEQTRYHNVWRISSYQPDFPLPPRPSNGTNIQSPGDTRFHGNPLQGLPRSRLTIEGVPRDHIDAPNPYPYTRESDTGDWVLNMPPSPSAAYAPAEQRAHPPLRRRSGNSQMQNGGRYMSRSDVRRHEWDAPPVIERALHAASVSMIQGLNVPVELYRGIRDTYYPLPGRPNIIKAYPIRRRLPVR